MSKRHGMNPTTCAKANGQSSSDNRSNADDYTRTDSTVTHMLSCLECLHHTVDLKTYCKSYKQKKELEKYPLSGSFSRTHMRQSQIETHDNI